MGSTLVIQEWSKIFGISNSFIKYSGSLLCLGRFFFQIIFTATCLWVLLSNASFTTTLDPYPTTDKHFWMLIIMYTNGYNSIPVMAGLKKTNKKNQKIKKNQRG